LNRHIGAAPGAFNSFGKSGSPTSDKHARAIEELVQKKDYIVIVETDDLIRALLERWLGEAGYAVIAGGSDAPDLGQPVRLIIVNVSKPRNPGALIRSIQAKYEAPILVISGRFRRGLSGSTDAARQIGVRKVLPKPFTRAELLAAVRESIGVP